MLSLFVHYCPGWPEPTLLRPPLPPLRAAAMHRGIFGAANWQLRNGWMIQFLKVCWFHRFHCLGWCAVSFWHWFKNVNKNWCQLMACHETCFVQFKEHNDIWPVLNVETACYWHIFVPETCCLLNTCVILQYLRRLINTEFFPDDVKKTYY